MKLPPTERWRRLRNCVVGNFLARNKRVFSEDRRFSSRAAGKTNRAAARRNLRRRDNPFTNWNIPRNFRQLDARQKRRLVGNGDAERRRGPATFGHRPKDFVSLSGRIEVPRFIRLPASDHDLARASSIVGCFGSNRAANNQ